MLDYKILSDYDEAFNLLEAARVEIRQKTKKELSEKSNFLRKLKRGLMA